MVRITKTLIATILIPIVGFTARKKTSVKPAAKARANTDMISRFQFFRAFTDGGVHWLIPIPARIDNENSAQII